MILVASEASDPTGQAVLARLERHGRSCRLLDFVHFPQRDRIRYLLTAGGVRRFYCADGQDIDLDAVHSILWRRPSRPMASRELDDAEVREYVEATSSEVLAGVFDDLGCLQVPASRGVLRAAHAKLRQLSLAMKLGFELPETLVTNSGEEFLDFYRCHEGRIVTKPAAVTVNAIVKGKMSGYARPARPGDLVHYRDLELCPLIVQAYVDKALELRVTVVASDVFAAEIHSQSASRTRFDWRRYDEGTTPHLIHALPDGVAERCRAMTRALGLLYSALDLILTPDGRYVFLELNPNGQYQWIEEMTGLPITDRIVRLLIDHS